MLPCLVSLLFHVAFVVTVVYSDRRFDELREVIWSFYTRDFVLHRVLESLIVLRLYGLVVPAHLGRVLLELCRVS
jgi:hypothetical protein